MSKCSELETELSKQKEKYSKDGPEQMIAMQLLDIIGNNEAAAALVLTDLAGSGMGLDACAQKIKECADAKHEKNKGSFACVMPNEAAEIIKKFYGITVNAVAKTSKTKSLIDFM